MRKLSAFCILTTVLCLTLSSLLFAEKTPVVSPKAEIQQIMQQIAAAKAADQDPDPALYARLDELLGTSRGGGSLDNLPSRAEVNQRFLLTQAGGTCATATAISSLPFSDSGLLDLQDNCSGRPRNDVFYVFTAPATAGYTFDMCGSPGDTYLRIWLGGTCCSDGNVTSDDVCGMAPSITVGLTAGQTVYIECGLYTASSTQQSYVFNAAVAAPPANDECVNAQALTIPSQTTGSTVSATVDNAPACGTTTVPTAPGVWYTVTGTGHTITASMCNNSTNWDAQLGIFTGPCGSLTCVAGNDDAGGNCQTRPRVSWCSEAGVTYYILVHGYVSASGSYRLDLTDNGAPCTDYCAHPVIIPNEYHYESSVTTCGGSTQVGAVYQYMCGQNLYASGPSVIYRFVLASSGVLDVEASGGDAQVMIFTDCYNPTGTCVASADSAVAEPEFIRSVILPAGIYYISISRYNGDCGDMTLIIDSDVPLPVTMDNFTATPGDGSVTLNWRTRSESAVNHFEILRDGQNLVHVASQGNTATGHSYTWTDATVQNDRVYTYDLYGVDLNGTRQLLRTAGAMPDVSAGMVTEYALRQNFPNPFNPTTSIAFDLVDKGNVSLKVYNLMGQEVANLVNGNMNAGRHIVSFNALNLSSGVYLYRLSVNGFVAEKKMLLMK